MTGIEDGTNWNRHEAGLVKVSEGCEIRGFAWLRIVR